MKPSTIEVAKQQANILKSFFNSVGYAVKLSVCQEAVAKINHARDWNTFYAQLSNKHCDDIPDTITDYLVESIDDKLADIAETIKRGGSIDIDAEMESMINQLLSEDSLNSAINAVLKDPKELNLNAISRNALEKKLIGALKNRQEIKEGPS